MDHGQMVRGCDVGPADGGRDRDPDADSVGQIAHGDGAVMIPGLFDLLEWAGYVLAGVLVTVLIVMVLGWLI